MPERILRPCADIPRKIGATLRIGAITRPEMAAAAVALTLTFDVYPQL